MCWASSARQRPPHPGFPAWGSVKRTFLPSPGKGQLRPKTREKATEALLFLCPRQESPGQQGRDPLLSIPVRVAGTRSLRTH